MKEVLPYKRLLEESWSDYIKSKVDFGTGTITRDKERHHKMMKRQIHREDITIPNVDASNKGSKYMKQKLMELQGEIDKLIIIIEDVDTSFLVADTERRQKINNSTEDQNSTTNQLDLVDI